MAEKITIHSQKEVLEINPVSLDYTSQIKIATESILRFMELEKIPFICYIDDRADISSLKNEYKGILTEIYVSQKKPEELSFVDWTIVPHAKFSTKISEDWKIFSSEEKKENFLKLSHYKKDSNFIPALMIQDVLGDKIKLFSPNAWIEDKYNVIKNIKSDERILCLFDIEFEGEAKPEDDRDGLDLAKHLLDSPYNTKCVCGVFSHLFSIDDEDDKRYEYASEKSLPIKQFYTISKERFAFDPKISAFAEGLKNLLLMPYVEKLKEESIKSFKDSFDESIKTISKISPKTFNQVVQKSSLKEGVWEISTLFRLHGIISKNENFNIISDPDKRKTFNGDINKIREIDLIETGYNSTSTNQQLINIRNKELYLFDNIINRLHLPITNGDIFEIKKKEYILLVQPCNLALRAKGGECGKRDYDYDTGILIPLKSIKKDKLNMNVEEIQVGEKHDKILVAYLPGFKTISMSILDLVVFNESGNGIIDLNNEVLHNEVIHFPWKKRYQYIYKVFSNFETKINEFSSVQKGFDFFISQKRKELSEIKVELNARKEGKHADIEEWHIATEENLLKSIELLPKEIGVFRKEFQNSKHNIWNIDDLKKFRIDCSKIYDPRTRTIDVKIKRKRHYKSPYSDDLLQNFMLYLSRNAFDHDFTS